MCDAVWFHRYVELFGRNMLPNTSLSVSKMETAGSDKPLCVTYQKNVTFMYMLNTSKSKVR
jgi:hypothetical protein